MADSYEHDKPHSLTATYSATPAPSQLTISYDLHATYDPDYVANTIDFKIDADFQFEMVATFTESSAIFASIDTLLDTDFAFEVEALLTENLCTIDTVLDTEFSFEVEALFDINHIVGLSLFTSTSFRRAITRLSVTEIPWAKPILRVSNEALFYDTGLTQINAVSIRCEEGRLLTQNICSIFEVTTGLSSGLNLDWQENLRLKKVNALQYEIAKKLSIKRQFDWVELIRKRKQITYSHEVAQHFEKTYQFEWGKGLELTITSDFAWQKARSIYYRKHPVQLWPEPEIPQYVGSTDLNFICLLHEVDSHNVVLNFGDEDCIPSLSPRNWWYIVNNIEVSRLDNGEKIKVIDGSYNTSRSQWCWSYNLTVPASEITKLEPINSQPVILKIQVNDNIHHMLLENRSRSRRFAEDVWKLTGRSQTALLDAPYSPTRSFLQENERTSVQLAQAELDRVNSDTQLNWQLIDELGWVVPTNSLSYANQTPIATIKQIAEAGGGFVYSEKGSNTLSIRAKYKKTFWDAMQFDDYDRLLPEGLVTSQSTDYEPYPDYNSVTLTNDRTGFTGQVKRTGTAGDVLQETVSNPLFTAVSMGGYGKALLAKAGMIETHSLEIPVQKDVGECEPGDVIAFNAEWWGIVESVSVSFSHAVINQNLIVERVLNE